MKEAEIRPAAVFEQYLELSRRDGEVILRSTQQFHYLDCPACQSARHEHRFEKFGFSYRCCTECNTLYCSPRPPPEQLHHLYADSPSARFWADEFFPAVAEARRDKLFRPKARMIAERMAARGVVPGVVCDVGAGYGFLLQELRGYWPEARMIAIEPHPKLAERCRAAALEVIERPLEQVDAAAVGADLVISFETLEHVFAPVEFAAGLRALTRPGGYTLVTTLGYDGFDIQVLQERSKSVSPPHHLNFLGRRGFTTLFQRAGFVDVEVTTPGELDVDIVVSALAAQPELEVPPVVRMLLAQGPETTAALQRFLREHGMSSHVWVMARRS